MKTSVIIPNRKGAAWVNNPNASRLAQQSGIGTVLWILAILSFVGGGLGLLLVFKAPDGDGRLIGLAAGLIGGALGCVLLTLTKIVDCLHETVCRLRKIEEQLKK